MREEVRRGGLVKDSELVMYCIWPLPARLHQINRLYKQC